MSHDLTDWFSDHLTPLSVCIYRLALDEKIDTDIVLVQVYQIYGKEVNNNNLHVHSNHIFSLQCLYIVFDCCVRDLLKSLSSVMDTVVISYYGYIVMTTSSSD